MLLTCPPPIKSYRPIEAKSDVLNTYCTPQLNLTLLKLTL